jgi:hypothetical protein
VATPLTDALARCLVASGQDSAAARLSGCGTWYMQECPECGVEVAPKQTFCRLRVCPDCAAREARKRFAVLRPAVVDLNTNKRGTWRLITLTLRNPPGPKDALWLEYCMRRVGKALYKLWRNILRKAGPWSGAIAGIEVGPSGNVHAHVLHFGDFVDRRRVAREWKRITGAYIVDIRRVRGNDLDALMGALAECTKYICNPTKTDARLLAQVNLATRRFRCFRTYGTMFDQTDPDFENAPATCPACLYTGPMNRGRHLCWQEADAWLSGLPYVRRTGSRAPPSQQTNIFKGLNFAGNFLLDLPAPLCQL